MPYNCTMGYLTVTAKGQITLKKNVLTHRGIKPGDKVAITNLTKGRIEMRPQAQATNIEPFFGSLKLSGQKRLSLKKMNQIIAGGWAGKR